MLLKYVETLQNTLAKQKSIDFCFVLYNFYVVKGNKKKYEHIAFDTFRHIKEQSNNRGDNGFWSDGSALLFVLENLDKNGFIETNLGSVLQDYDTWLIAQISRQRMDFKQRDLSFYIQLLFDRRRHLNINVAPVNTAFTGGDQDNFNQFDTNHNLGNTTRNYNPFVFEDDPEEPTTTEPYDPITTTAY